MSSALRTTPARGPGEADAPGILRLMLVYTLLCAVPVLVLGAALAASYRQEASDRGREYGRVQAEVITQMVVLPALDAQSLELGVPARVRDRLQVSADLARRQGALARLRLRAFSGSVAFSDDGSSSSVDRSSAPFQAALQGATDIAVVTDSSAGPGRSVRVLGPLPANATGRPTGVLELYLPYEPIAANVERGLHRQFALLATGLALLSGTLGVICWATTRRLRRVAALREHEARHDSLTGLPNRAAYTSALEAVVRQRTPALVALLDLDGFKRVNDLLGHRAGDLLLAAVGAALRDALPPGALAARLGGDEFALLLPGFADRDAAADDAADVLRAVAASLGPVLARHGGDLPVGVSVGGALHPAQSQDPAGLLHCADLAMYQAKYATSCVQVYSPLLDELPVGCPDRSAASGRERRSRHAAVVPVPSVRSGGHPSGASRTRAGGVETTTARN